MEVPFANPKPPAPPAVLYRMREQRYAAAPDEYGEPIPGAQSPLEVHLETWLVAKVTPKGWRLQSGRFVLRAATKQWASPTVEAAIDGFLARKRKQESIYLARAKTAREAANVARRVRERAIQEAAALGDQAAEGRLWLRYAASFYDQAPKLGES